MRRLVVLAAAAALAAGACTSDKPTSRDSATTTSAALSVSDDVQRRLLGVADLPAGFEQTASASPEPNDDSSTGCAAFDDYNAKYGTGAAEDAQVDFQLGELDDAGTPPPGGVKFLNESVQRWASTRQADASFDAVAAAFGTCATFSSTDADGRESRGEMAKVSFPKLGDDSVAVHVKFTLRAGEQSADFEGDLAAVRVGKFVSLVLSLGYDGPQLPASDFERVVRKAAAKL